MSNRFLGDAADPGPHVENQCSGMVLVSHFNVHTNHLGLVQLQRLNENQWFSIRNDFSPRGHLAMFEDIFDFYKW